MLDFYVFTIALDFLRMKSFWNENIFIKVVINLITMNFMVKNIRFGREWFGKSGWFRVPSLKSFVTINLQANKSSKFVVTKKKRWQMNWNEHVSFVNKKVHQMKGAPTKAWNVKKGLKLGVNIKQ